MSSSGFDPTIVLVFLFVHPDTLYVVLPGCLYLVPYVVVEALQILTHYANAVYYTSSRISLTMHAPVQYHQTYGYAEMWDGTLVF